MTPLEPSRFADGPPMLFAGLRRTHTFADSAEGIPAQWRAFHALGQIPHQRGATHYGVLCGGDVQAQTMEYMCAVEVSAFDDAAPHLGRMRVPPQHYAVFEHTGPPSAVQRTWLAIWNEWTPRSGRIPVHGPEFEVYGERFDPATGTGVIEIWSPVQPLAGG
jgi:AraC family transcriptional regulator